MININIDLVCVLIGFIWHPKSNNSQTVTKHTHTHTVYETPILGIQRAGGSTNRSPLPATDLLPVSALLGDQLVEDGAELLVDPLHVVDVARHLVHGLHRHYNTTHAQLASLGLHGNETHRLNPAR